MILRNRSNGPRYTTDAVAQSVAQFVSQRHEIASTAPRPSVLEAPGALEDLYPSLFATSQADGFAIVSEALRSGLSRVVATLARRRFARSSGRS